MSKAKFTAELFEGHKDVHAVIVPFDPQEVWGQKPVKIDPRRDGWLIHGTMNKVRFLGWIGYRWGRFFIIVDPEMRETLGVEVGANIVFVVEPTNSEAAMKIAREQAKLTTAPSKRKKRRAYGEQKGRPDRKSLPSFPSERPASPAVVDRLRSRYAS